MSWHYSQALVEEFLQDTCSDGEPSAPSSGNPTPQAYLCSDRMTAFSRLSRFGMTFAPLTGNRGTELLTWYLAGFPARTSQQQGAEPESRASGLECGWKWPESSMKYDPDSRSWKTRQCSLLGGLVEFSETWPRSGTMRNGESWERPTLERRTEENESGSWPTPMKSTAGKSPKTLELVISGHCHMTLDRALAIRGDGVGLPNPMWVEWLMGWPQGWTSMDALETDKSHSAPLKPGGYSQED